MSDKREDELIFCADGKGNGWYEKNSEIFQLPNGEIEPKPPEPREDSERIGSDEWVRKTWEDRLKHAKESLISEFLDDLKSSLSFWNMKEHARTVVIKELIEKWEEKLK